MKWIRLFFMLTMVLALAACGKAQAEPITISGFLLDTYVAVTVYDSRDRQILEDAYQLCADYEQVFSRTKPGSEVHALNRAGGEPVAVSEDLLAVLEAAVAYAELTGGRYDVTICPVVDLWNFTSDNPSLPDRDELDAALSLVGWEHIVIEGNTVSLLGGAQVDLGSIAKGYIADRMADLLRDRGVESALIDLGGNIVTIGVRPGGAPFRIGVQQPDEDRGTVAATIPVADRSVVTSGTYERSFTLDGVLYHHILDVDTGYPAHTGLSGISVLADSSMDADALSTSLFLLGAEDGLSLAQDLGVEALFLHEDGTVTGTDGFLALMEQ